MSTFRIISQALENNVVNLAVYLLAITLEVFQLAPLFIVIGLRVADQDPVAYDRFEPLTTTLLTFTGTKSILNASFMTVFAFAVVFLPIYIIVIVLMIYTESTLEGKNRDSRSFKLASCFYKVVSALFVLISTILSWPMYLLQILPFNCSYNSSGATYVNQPDITCWTGLHLALVVINGFNILLFLILVIVYETLFNDTSPRSRVPWACTQANKMRLVKHLSKITLGCFTVFDPVSKYYNYLFVIELLIHLLILYVLFMSPSYINRICGHTVLYLESFMLFLMVGMYAFRLTNIIVLYICFLMLLALLLVMSGLTVFTKSKYDQYILTIQVTGTKNEFTKEYYFYELFRLLDWYNADDPGVVINLYGIYSNHQLMCNNPNCSCSTGLINKNIDAIKKREEAELGGERSSKTPGDGPYEGVPSSSRSNMASMFQIALSRSLDDMQGKSEGQPENKEEDKEGQMDNFNLLIEMCTSLIDFEVASSIGSVTLRMISAYYSREYIGNIFKTVYELEFIEEKQKPSFRDKFLIYKYKNVIEEEMNSISKKGSMDNGMDVEKLIEFEKHYETFRAQAESTSNIVNRFWEQLKSKDLDVNGLYEIGSKVGTLYNEMLANYSVAVGIFPHNYKLVSEFGYFEKAIMNNDIIAKSYEQKARQIEKEQAEQHREGVKNYEGEIADVNSVHHTCICVVSGNPNTMGDIVTVNNEIMLNLGFKAKEVIGQNCGVLCPQYISAKHNQMIENFIKRGTSNFLKSRRVIVACNSRGFLVLMETFIKVLPSVDEGIRFVGIFRTLEDYSEFFKEKGPCLPSDFAFIVTSMDGQILGINETCMTRLGIPVSLFKPRGGAEDAILINTLIKETGESDTEELLLTEGKKLKLDTKVLQFSINKENLSKKEIRALDENAGKYTVFVKQSNESYGQGLAQVKVYKMLICGENDRLSPGETTRKRATIVQPGSPDAPPQIKSTFAETNRLPTNKDVPPPDKDEGKTIVEDEESHASSGNLRGLNEFKQSMNVKSATINVTVIKRTINLVFLFMVIIASVEFALLLVEQASYVKSLDIVFTANRRVTDIGLIHSQVLTMVRQANTSGTPTYVNGIDQYAYLREYGLRSISTLGTEEDYLNTLGFDYTSALTQLEKNANVSVLTLGMNGQQSTTAFTINTAITQYNAKASDFMSYTFSALNTTLVGANYSSTITSQYFFVKENGIGDLTIKAQASEEEFRSVLRDRMGTYLPYFIGAAVLIGVSMAICFGILVPKLIGLQREKINVLMLYTQMNRREVDSQMAKCLEYQKSNGFWDYNDESEALDSKESFSGSETFPGDKKMDAKEPEKPNATTQPGDEVKALMESKRKSSESEDSSSESSDSSEDEDAESEAPPRDENEITIQEQLNSEQLKGKLTTNKCSLIMLVVMVSSLYCCYFIVGAVKPVYDANDMKDGLKFLNGLSQMLKSPLYLIVYALVSVYESRTIYVNGQEVINAYLDEFLDSNSFKQTLTSASNSFLSNTKKLFDTLDSPSLCSELINMYQLIRDEYPESSSTYTYTIQKSITQSVCEAYQDQLLTRGLTQAAFMIHQEVKKLLAEKTTSASVNATATEQVLAMLQIFLAPIYEGLVLSLKTDIKSNLDTLKEFQILFFIFYLLISLIVHLLFWTCFLKAMETELIKSRGMLKIMPLELIDKIKKLRREKANMQIINFLKAFEKA